MAQPMGEMIAFIPDRLYYTTATSALRDDEMHHYFSTDQALQYYPFEADFGPLNLGQSYAFFAQLSGKLKDPQFKSKRIVYYSSPKFNFRANSVTLISLFMVCVLSRKPSDVLEIVRDISPALTPYRDASMGPCLYGVTVSDILCAADRALKTGLFSLKEFKYDDYYFYSQVENGDLTWITEHIIAFAGPVEQSHPFFRYHPFTPQSYIPLFKARGVSAVVRLNESCYNRADFIKQGIHHYDLPYPDGSVPSDRIVEQFLQILRTEKGAVAVHCKAGLGRTGTLIGIHMMVKYGFTAREIIAWLRVMRPGSVLGGQQQFLCEYESKIDQLRAQLQSEGQGRESELLEPELQPQLQLQPEAVVRGQHSNTEQRSTAQRGPLFGYAGSYATGETSAQQAPRQLNSAENSYQNQTASVYMSPGRTSAFSNYSTANSWEQRQQTYSPQVRKTQPMPFYSPQRQHAQQTEQAAQERCRTPKQEQKLDYGFGTNGRVHPDVVQTPQHVLEQQSAGLPSIQRGREGAGKVSDW